MNKLVISTIFSVIVLGVVSSQVYAQTNSTRTLPEQVTFLQNEISNLNNFIKAQNGSGAKW